MRMTKAVRAAVSYCNSTYFIWTLGGVWTLLNIAGLDVLNYFVLGAVFIFLALFSDDSLAVIAPAVLVPFTPSRRRVPVSMGVSDFYQQPSVYIPLYILAGLCGAAFVFRIVRRAEWKKIFRRRMLTYGFGAVGLAFLLNGMFSGEYSVKSTAIGLMLWLAMIVLYVYMSGTVERRDSMQYFARLFFVLGVGIAVQVLGLFLDKPALLDGSDKNSIRLAWGISNRVGSMLLILMPFAYYLMCRSKYALGYMLAGLGMLAALVFTYSRASLLFALPLTAFCLVYGCVKARDRRTVLIATAGFALAAGVLLAFNFDKLSEIFRYYAESGLDDHGRKELWIEALEKYLRAPIFGYGYAYKFDEVFARIYSPHNTFLQYLCFSGLFGLVCYLYHRMETVWLFLHRMTPERLFLGLSIAVCLGFGMLDVSMKTEIMVLLMGAVYAIAEKDYERTGWARPLY